MATISWQLAAQQLQFISCIVPPTKRQVPRSGPAAAGGGPSSGLAQSGPAANAIQHLPCKWQLSCRHRLVGSRELVNQTTRWCHSQRQAARFLDLSSQFPVLGSQFSVLSGSSRKSAAGCSCSCSFLSSFPFGRLDSSRLGSARLGALNRRSTGALIAINLH